MNLSQLIPIICAIIVFVLWLDDKITKKKAKT